MIAAAEAIVAILIIATIVFMGRQFRTMQDNQDNSPKASIEDTTKEETAEGVTEVGETPGQTLLLLDNTLETVAQSITGKKNNTGTDYDQITRIAVIGNRIYSMDTELENLEELVYNHEFDNNLINGGINDITLLSRMHNLREVFLCDQKITDITPLKGLSIEKLYLSGNQINDFSVIETLKELQVLYIVNNPVSVLPDISKCRQLLTLNLCGNTYKNLDFLKETNIGKLYITDIYVEDKDFTPLQKMPNLTFLYTTRNQQEVYEILPELSQLTGLALWDYREKDLSILKSLSKLEDLYVAGEAVERMDGIEYAPEMRNFCIDGTSITDISRLTKLKRILFFKINGTAIKDYTPLFHCSSLQTLSTDSKQEQEINNLNSEHAFRIVHE